MPQDVHTLEGHLLADRYRVERVLGEGGMGQVLLAYHVDLAQRVAVKLLQPGLALRDPTATERFKREARTSARIRHEHVCRVLDAGTLADGTPYLAMEYLDGRDLGEELSERGRLNVSEAVGFVRQACEGVQEAHRLGIVHRDLKPQNLFLARTDEGALSVKVLDFGISKARVDDSAGNARLTRTASLVGSPLYMSPEQLHADQNLDSRADLWGLGCILYELISGRPPFVGESIPQLVHAVLHLEPPTLASLGVTVPGGLEAVIGRALQKDRNARFASAREFGEALLPYGPRPDTAASGARARTPEPYLAPGDAAISTPSAALDARLPSASQSSAVPGHTAAATAVAAPPRAIRARKAMGFAALGFLAVLGALTISLFSRQRSPQGIDGPAMLPAAPSDASVALDPARVPALPTAPAALVPSSALSPHAAATEPDAATLGALDAQAALPELAAQPVTAPATPGAVGARSAGSTPVWQRRNTQNSAQNPAPAASGSGVSAAPAAASTPAPEKSRASGLPSFGGRR